VFKFDLDTHVQISKRSGAIHINRPVFTECSSSRKSYSCNQVLWI